MSFFIDPPFTLAKRFYNPKCIQKAIEQFREFCDCSIEESRDHLILKIAVHPEYDANRLNIVGELLNTALGESISAMEGSRESCF